MTECGSGDILRHAPTINNRMDSSFASVGCTPAKVSPVCSIVADESKRKFWLDVKNLLPLFREGARTSASAFLSSSHRFHGIRVWFAFVCMLFDL